MIVPSESNPANEESETGFVSNPFSSGGGGVRFENQVQASFLAMMLVGGSPPVLVGESIQKIKLQGRYAGFHTDDLIIFTGSTTARSESPRLLAQIKHKVSFTKSDKVLKQFVKGAWRDWEDSNCFTRDQDAFALITGPLSATDIADVRVLLEWARHSESAQDFLQKVELANFSSTQKREKLAVLRATVDEAKTGLATLHGTRIRHEGIPGAIRPENTYVGNWTDSTEYVTWKVRLAVGTWSVSLHKRRIGLSSAVDADSQIEIDVRNEESSQVVVSRRIACPRGHYHIPAADLRTELPGEYVVTVSLIQGSINLESLVLDSSRVVKHVDGVLTLSADTARLLQPSAGEFIIELERDGQHHIPFRATGGERSGVAYWTTVFDFEAVPNVIMGTDNSFEVCYSTSDADARIVIEVYELNQETALSSVAFTCVATGGLSVFRRLESIWPNAAVRVPKSGSYRIAVRMEDPVHGMAINVRSIRLQAPIGMSLD